MNPFLPSLQPYPFEKLKKLTSNAVVPDLSPIAWSIGEPKHAAPDFLKEVLLSNIGGYSNYPATAGLPELKDAIANWVRRRFLPKHPSKFVSDKHVLPVTGTREALFSVVQALYNPNEAADEVWMPNPFYQIYEGATILAGGHIRFLNCSAQTRYQPDFFTIKDDDWQQCQILFICTPGNPSGSTLPKDQLVHLVKKARQHNVIIISDECYSELYRDESNPPAGILEACDELGQGYANCLAFHSLSKRSNLPGLRSGFVAGDEDLICQFLKYRTYHGCAMPFPHQQVSIAAWNDESHVVANRRLYNEKFQAVVSELKNVIPVSIPEASFYLWPNLETDDEQIALHWLEKANIHVLPGQYLSRDYQGQNPGFGHVRIALVATLDECIEATRRLKRLL